MINKVMLLGNMGQDPELRHTASGHAVTTISLATNRKWKDREGAKKEETTWHQVVCWGRTAEVVEQYLVKGSRVFIEGRLQTRSWVDNKTGDTKYRTEVVCENLQMLGGDRRSGGAPPPENPPGGYGGGSNDGGYDDDEIPF